MVGCRKRCSNSGGNHEEGMIGRIGHDKRKGEETYPRPNERKKHTLPSTLPSLPSLPNGLGRLIIILELLPGGNSISGPYPDELLVAFNRGASDVVLMLLWECGRVRPVW